MRKIKTVTLFPGLSVILCAGLAVLLVGTAPALAAKPAPAVQTPLSPTKIPQFAQPLDVLDPAGVKGVPAVINPDLSVKTVVDLSICEFQTTILPPGTPVPGATATVGPPTWVWGYQVGSVCAPNLDPNTNLPVVQPRSYLGPVVIADRGTPTQMTYYNKLPNANVAKVKAYTTSTDQTLIWGDPLSLDVLMGPQIDGAQPYPYSGAPNPEANECWLAAQLLPLGGLMPAACLNNYGYLALQPTTSKYAAPVPAAVHIHGGEVPSVLDGGPDSWWTANGIYGHGYYSKGGIFDATSGKAVYVYPNGQEAAPVWFHDHMLGATRLNVYAGIAGGYIIKEPASTLAPGLAPLGLSDKDTGVLTELTIPLIIQDRMFDTAGQLYFPNVGINPEHPYWVPEFVGDTICVNGKAWPFLNVKPKRYRFLFLNGSNARSYELFFNGGPSLWVIGNDQGYLDAPQQINPAAKVNNKLTMMPGERYEVIIDFAAFAGKNLILQNTARTPWVGGAPVNGNTTGKVMQFRVGPAPVPAVLDNTFNPALAGATVRKTPMVRLVDLNLAAVPPTSTPHAGMTIHKVRRLTVNEAIGAGGPLEVLVNNTLYDGSKSRAPYYNDFTPIPTKWNTTYYSELPHEGETELWEILNLTADAHPMHPHLVAFQILDRQALDVKGYTAAYNLAFPGGLPLDGWGPPLDYNCGLGAPGPGVISPLTCVYGGNPDPAPSLVGLPVPPAPQEIGWKDTVQVLPNMVTRILVRFAKADLPANTPAADAGYNFSPNGGHGYVWHCHIVDHEDNEMMRPFSVNANCIDFCDPSTAATAPCACVTGDNRVPRSYVQGINY